MKRIVSLVLCMTLALGAVTYRPPKANAMALEITAALVGKVVGVTLISWGMAWAVDQISENMTVQRFGENVAREIQNWLDEEHNCEVIDVFFGGMMPNTSPDPSPTGNVVLTASAAFIAAVSAFGKWLYDKYALAENETAVVSTTPGSMTVDGKTFTFAQFDYDSSAGTHRPEFFRTGTSVFEYVDIDAVRNGTPAWFNLSDTQRFSISYYSSTFKVTFYNGSDYRTPNSIDSGALRDGYQDLFFFSVGDRLGICNYYSDTSPVIPNTLQYSASNLLPLSFLSLINSAIKQS